jgi:hypothetical protein
MPHGLLFRNISLERRAHEKDPKGGEETPNPLVMYRKHLLRICLKLLSFEKRGEGRMLCVIKATAIFSVLFAFTSTLIGLSTFMVFGPVKLSDLNGPVTCLGTIYRP